MQKIKLTKKVFLFLLALIGFAGMKAQQSAQLVPECTTSYSVVNPQGIVVSSGTTGNPNPTSLGAICPGFNLIVKLTSMTPPPTTIGAFVTIGTSSTVITYTLFNPTATTLTVPITVYDPLTPLPCTVTIGLAPQFDGDGCQNFIFDIYPKPDPSFIISPNPVCLNSTVCFSSTAAPPYSLATQNFGGYYIGAMNQTLYNNIVLGQAPNFSGSVTCNPATVFGVGIHTITNITSIGSSGFCFNSQTNTLQVLPALGTVSISAPTTPICSGQPATLTASAVGATSYTWFPGNIVGNPITINPTINTSYTVIASNANNCTNTAVANVEIVPCCLAGRTVINLSNVNIVAPGASTLVWSSLASGGSYNGNISLPTSTYIIQGSYNVIGGLTISTPVSIANTHMAFADAISVNQNAATSIDRSYWHGCDKNWQGILSTRQLTVTNSVFEDAAGVIQINATVNNHNGLLVDNTIFNKNVYGMIITGSKLASYKLTGSIFTSRDIPAANYLYTTGQRWTSLANFNNTTLATYNAGFLKGSVALGLPNTARGQVGIYFGTASLLITAGNLNGNITIGDASTTPTVNSSYTNVFDYLRIGEYNSKSRLITYNSWHQYISSIPAADLYGNSTACVYNNSTPRAIIGSNALGTGLNIYSNNFTNSTNGIYAANNGTLNVYNNQFTTITQYGVQVENWNCTNTQTVQINNNNFATCLYDLYAFNNNTIKLNFSTNTSTYPFVTVKPKVTYHAYISEISSPATAIYYIGFGNSSGKVNGVYCINTYSPAVVNNTITVRTPIGTGFNAPIWLDNTHQGDIKFNTLSVNPTNLNSYNTFGIFTNLGNNNLFCENYITGAGSCMKFQGSSPSRIYRNNLNSVPTASCLFGIFLDNNGSVGPIKYNTSCADNIFGDFNYPGNGADTYAQNGSIGSSIDYSGANTSNNPYCPFSNLVNPAIPLSTSFTKVINNSTGVAVCIVQPMGAQMVQQSSSSGSTPTLSSGVPIIMNSASNFSSNNLIMKAIANKTTFELAKKSAINTSTIVGGTVFMNTNSNNSIGSFYKMDSLVGRFAVTNNTATLNQAKNLNTALVAVGVIETNQKTFNTVYHLFMKDESLITVSHINTLKKLAALCPFTDGTSVYQSRALVKRFDTTEFVNACENNPVIVNNGNRFMNSNTELNQSAEALSTLIYPNPAGNEITVSTDVDGSKLFIFSLLGQLLLESDLSTLTKINVSDFKNGTYIYKIVKDAKIIKTDKLIISK
jgi:hypothetical protein